MPRVQSAFGAIALLGLAFLLCPAGLRRQIRWRTVGGGLGLVIVFALLALRPPLDRVFASSSRAVDLLLGFSKQGAAFMFGSLVNDSERFGFIFAFQVLPTLIFFAALMSALYYVGLMPLLIRGAGRLLSHGLGTSGPESFSTAADIFVGQTEAPLVIRPYIKALTRSELMACMTAGFATTAGGVLAAYVIMLRDMVPNIAGHLIACSVMCAPASLVIAKLMLPESEARGRAPARTPQANAAPQPDVAAAPTPTAPRAGTEPRPPNTPAAAERAEPAREPDAPASLLEAITVGTSDGLYLALNIAAMLIAFLALTALVDFMLGELSSLLPLTEPLSLVRLFSWLFAPLAWLLGVDRADVFKVAGLLGQKTVLNEFVAYTTLSEKLKADPAWLSERSRLIASYALCGFANFSSIGIQIGGYSSLAPERRSDLAALAPRAMLAGLLATCLVACVAGVLL